ncbi:MAG TPA: sulfatase-like hydrolase/transferase [Thermoanaerobaculia bacterium]|nr:sulfatase-like hydrolase/transferase [Thermoanaerobaculia bacterium]
MLRTLRRAVLAMAMLSMLRCGRAATQDAPADVILVTIDTLRADALGFRGNQRVKTPFLDSLAARGTVFTHAHAHNVVTLPSHANILTGLYPWQHGIRDNAGFTLDAKHLTIAARLREHGFATGAFVSAFPLDSRYGLDRGFDVYDDSYPANANALDFAVQERPGHETLQRAASWWNAAAGRKRFLFVHLYEPHAPYLPPPPFAEQYRNEPYLGEVAATDAMLARALGPLLEAAPNALVIVTGDHGEALGDHGEKTHGLFAYESTLAVPLLVVDPSRRAAVDDRYVRHIDIAPTILARAGIAAPAEWKGMPLFAEGERGYTYFEALSASLNRGWAPLVGAIEGGRKLIELPVPELYDLPTDPKETRNRFAEERRSVTSIRARLRADAPAATASRQDVGSEEQATLLSLGYLSGTSAKTSYTAADDPKNLVDLDNELHEAIAAYQAGDLARALQRANALAAARPDMQIAQEMLAFFLAQNERPDEAIHVLERRVQSGRANDAVRIRLGLLLSETGRAREAIALLSPFADRTDPDLLNAYGIALADNGDVPGAVRQFERILATDSTNARAFQNLGIVALRAGQTERARGYLDRSLSLSPNLPLALNAMGVVEARSGNRRGAIDRWSRAVAVDPMQFDALFNLGIVAADSGQPDIARKALRDYLERAPAKRYATERSQAAEVLRGLGP